MHRILERTHPPSCSQMGTWVRHDCMATKSTFNTERRAMIDLNGKRALVTGGSRGIGAAIALALAENGADVAFTYQHSIGKAESEATSLDG